MNLPEDLLYSPDHEWVRREGSRIRLGVTDYAQDALGDVVYVALPEIGTEVVTGDSFGEIESTKSVSDLYAPVRGTIVAINSALNDSPDLINGDPYGEGWICEIDPTDDADLQALLSAEAYRTLIDG